MQGVLSASECTLLTVCFYSIKSLWTLLKLGHWTLQGALASFLVLKKTSLCSPLHSRFQAYNSQCKLPACASIALHIQRVTRFLAAFATACRSFSSSCICTDLCHAISALAWHCAPHAHSVAGLHLQLAAKYICTVTSCAVCSLKELIVPQHHISAV